MRDEEKKEVDKFKKTLFLLGIIWFVFRFLFSINLVSGNSMSDTVYDGGIVFTNKLNFEINRFDIVLAEIEICNGNSKYGQVSIKRVIGLPNDLVEIKNGVIFVNGEELEKYNLSDEDFLYNKIQLKKDEYFIVGDNRNGSYDSRHYGAVVRKKIIGKVVCILYKGG